MCWLRQRDTYPCPSQEGTKRTFIICAGSASVIHTPAPLKRGRIGLYVFMLAPPACVASVVRQHPLFEGGRQAGVCIK